MRVGFQSDLYGSAGWADGVAPVESDATGAVSAPEGLSSMRKIAVFGFVLMAAVFYVRLRKSASKNNFGLMEKQIA